MGVVMTDFYSRDRNKAFDEVKENLYEYLKEIEECISEYDPSDPDFEDTYAEGYYDRLVCEHRFLRNMLDKMERS